jgi:S-adenosylmethionine:tRNA ribosyltransferase-isomerase
VSAVTAFDLPAALEAHAPPEARGLARDEVRLMVAPRAGGEIEHARFRDLPRYLRAGDLLVVNTSATVAAAVDGRRADGTPIEVRFSTVPPDLPDGRWWLIELRAADGAPLPRAGRPGERVALPGDAVAELLAPYAGGPRLWLARVDGELPLERHGRPVRYGYVPEPWPLAAYQTEFALHPGSAEMPSAGRPFSTELVTRLTAAGVLVAPVLLHTGLSSSERGEPPVPERFAVPSGTARVVNAVRDWGGRVVAVGTTVVRALETVAEADGTVSAGRGFTSLVVSPQRGLRAVDGLITGWHEAQATHLELLEAAAGRELLARSYDAALREGYLWHEFGDSHLILG